MALIELDQVSKEYEQGTRAVDAVDLRIEDGEFMVLVGPSGCGKTTLLRMIAGLEEITSGELRIGDRVVNQLLPRDRDVAMVFQNYALFPHMTVFENMAFGLRLAKVSKADRRRRVQETARILDLEELLERKPRQLSGGQRQRVAMGRAIIRTPQAFLMDEPLSNLDAKLRVQMRAEISRLQDELKVTTVYVTHDQVEAMTMGDRVAVMRRGRVQQVGSPLDLFEHPANVFVAGFIGSPAMNLVRARVRHEGNQLVAGFGSHRLALPEELLSAHPGIRGAEREVILGVRPQAFAARAPGAEAAGPLMDVTVTLAEPLGTDTLIRFDVDAPPVVTEDLMDLAADVGSEAVTRLRASATAGTSEFVASIDPRIRTRSGETLMLTVDPGQLYFFDPESGVSLAGEPRGENPVSAPATVSGRT